MSQQINLESNKQEYVVSPLESKFIEQISCKSDQVEAIVGKFSAILKIKYFTPNIRSMIESTKKMMSIIQQNLGYLNDTELFRDDFNKSIHIVDMAYDCYIKSLNSIVDPIKELKLINFLKINIDSFAQSIIIFSSIFQDVINDISKAVQLKERQSVIDLINTRLGLESALFNFSVDVQPSNESPFFKSRFVELYKCYNDINKIKDNIAAIKSVCGTGKTLCLPIILLCRSLKDKMNAPFVLITQPSPKHVESKEHFFNKTISKYATIISDPDKLTEIYNDYEKTLSIQKLVLGVLTPHNLLPLMYALRFHKQFYPHTRIIIDEIHQRTFHLDVLISKIALFDQNLKIFNLPLSVILTSASITPTLLKPYKGKVKVTTLIQYPPFEIVEKKPIIEKDIQKIDNEIVRNETIAVIEDMAKINSSVEEGHILCFLSGIMICDKLKKSIMSHFRHTNETQTTRKIVVLQTTLRPNESIESYFRRLRDEYMLNEGLREGKNYKNNFLYIVPLVLSGLVEDTIYELAQNEFPGDLSKINKLICSTPMIESSFTIDKLSVVVDSGLVKENEFDLSTCLTTWTEKQASKESMDQRKGRLGRTMKGLYVPIHAPFSEIPDIQTPPIQRLDLATNILLMKDINIDFEKMNNLPTPPNKKNLEFAMETLKYIKAIDPNTLKITPFGHELLNYPFISIYYAAAVINYRESFQPEEKMSANFLAAYISIIVTMDTLLVQEYMSEKMSRYFKVDSDITTLINPLNILLRSDITDNDQMRDLVESYGFSYSSFLVFKTHMQEITDLTFPGKTIADVIKNIGGFVGKYKGITAIVDDFIYDLVRVYPKWKQTHQIYFKYVSGAGGFDSRPTLVFNGDQNLKFQGQRQYNAEVRVSKRPGWNGIMIPTECYCFNISRNVNTRCNIGRLVHRMHPNELKCAITSIECDKIALNPWFDVLLDTYFRYEQLNLTMFSNIIKTNNNNNHQQRPNFEYRNFHYSNAGERVFLSFIPKDETVKDIVVSGVNDCLKLMPFTPRSILVFREDVQHIVEITSIGTEHYETSISSYLNGGILDRRVIEYCLQNLNLLAKSDSPIRICASFTKETCKLSEYDQRCLYYISDTINSPQIIKNVVCGRINYLNHMHRHEERMQKYLVDQNHDQQDELGLFQFPAKFIHPALLYHQESLDCILKWFKGHCNYAKVERVIGHRLLIRQREIPVLQHHIRYEKEKILQEMDLNYVAIPVPSHVYAKAYLSIREHPTWDYNDRFKVIVTTKDQVDDVNELIEKIKNEIGNENKSNREDGFTDTLCCCYICDDPDNPVLTNYPITIYYKDGSTYTNKMCRDCLACNIQVATESFFVDGKIDQNALERILIKPAVIPSVPSKEDPDGQESWPQIPLGQMISALINNDDELSALTSAWLEGVSEYTIRTQAKDRFAFCPDHPHVLYDIKRNINTIPICHEKGCKNLLCPFCNCWHESTFICPEKKEGKQFTWPTKCPKCQTPIFKDGGCNHITCPCGCHWCYKCGEGFKTAAQCYAHLSKVHGGCFDYQFDD
ncbi:hypothetical protein M9Y10_025443 [Tritrichomonas musculus]|uniref:C2H2-type domain-containing protein n=1 Tax=Tritrichomonas musculus TaxID=1915356 RepID=A0ABR2HB25_9EUKA